MIMAQANDMLETARAAGGLPTSAVLALVCAGLIWWVLRQDTKLEAERKANDDLQAARLQDLKDTIKDLGGGKEAP
jgi:hypothetical protein